MTAMRILGVLATSLMLAACPSTPPGDIDAPLPDDSQQPSKGLTLTFSLVSPLPTGDAVAQISEIDLKAMRVSAIGDAASGDKRTTRTDYEMKWTPGTPDPEPITFAEAPVGMYSSIEIQLTKLDVGGTCLRNNNQLDFEIGNEETVSLSVPIDATLTPGNATTIAIAFDAGALIAGIDWDDQKLDGGDVKIDENDDAMVSILAALQTAFRPQ